MYVIIEDYYTREIIIIVIISKYTHISSIWTIKNKKQRPKNYTNNSISIDIRIKTQ